MRHTKLNLAAALVAAAACSGPREAARSRDTDAALEIVETPHEASPELSACADAQLASVESIADVVAQLNVLPTDSVPCLVASLPRPFGVLASASTLSAQPAESDASPRIFVMEPQVVLTVVPEGAGASSVELGQWVTSTRTLKAELKLPATRPLEDSAPHSRIIFGDNQTVCSQCHRNEERTRQGAVTFVSDALRPAPDKDVSINALRAEHEACVQNNDTSSRCDLYHAIFDFGEVEPGAFASDVKQMGAR